MTVSANPVTSDLVTEATVDGIPPDTIVIQGYLGPTDIFKRANDVIANYNAQIDPDIGVISTANITSILAASCAPWRLYISARLNRYVEIEDWSACVVRFLTEQHDDRLESHTVWLRCHYAKDHDKAGLPISYPVVTIDALVSASGFVAGELVEDFMSRSESRNVVWDEQQYGPTTGKKSDRSCF